jgi:NADPH-dependent 7-cyano-7-deazaguanine reductase QueF
VACPAGVTVAKIPGGNFVLTEYTLEVQSLCPEDSKLDIYTCTVRARRTIQVEDILKAVAEFKGIKLFQEDLTRELHRKLAAKVETVGYHSGVKTKVVCG